MTKKLEAGSRRRIIAAARTGNGRQGDGNFSGDSGFRYDRETIRRNYESYRE